eukprot:11214324-Lingulodinium_polyedra.AAC.1
MRSALVAVGEWRRPDAAKLRVGSACRRPACFFRRLPANGPRLKRATEPPAFRQRREAGRRSPVPLPSASGRRRSGT